MLWRSTIQTENHDQPAGFQPQNQQAQVNDAIFWVNDDRDVQHQPYPVGGETNAWCKAALSGSERTDSIALENAGTIDYLCAIHADETGTIVVANAVSIGRTADDPPRILFVPASLQINQGESVSWANSDMDAHQPAPVGGPDTEWFAQPIPSGEVSAQISFPNAGTIAYRCAVPDHTDKGTIVVPHVVTTGIPPSFDPHDVAVHTGDSVVWQNNDTQDHLPTPDSGAAWFTAPITSGSASTPIVFSTAGNVPYHCELHPTETGTIDVTVATT
jgi:plastocyanin